MAAILKTFRNICKIYQRHTFVAQKGYSLKLSKYFCNFDRPKTKFFFRIPYFRNRINQWKIWTVGSYSVAAAVLNEDDEKDKEEEEKDKKSFEEDQVILIIKHAKLAEMKGEYDHAEKFYHRVLKMLSSYEQNKAWDDANILQAKIYVYDNMANLALSQGRLQDAEELYKETMKGLLQKGIEKDDNAIIEISLKVTMIYVMQRKFAEAESGYLYAITSQENKIKEDHHNDANSMALLGMCVNSYSRYLMLRKRLPEARVQMEKAIEIAKKSLGDDSQQVAVLLNDAANVGTIQGDYDYAIDKLNAALILSEAADSPDVPAFYCNLGEVLMKKGDFVNAKENCSKAYRLAKKLGNTEAEKEAKACLNDIKTKR